MEAQVLHVLEQTQSPHSGPRQQAEQQLLDSYHNPDYPLTLCSIASHTSVPPASRQAALLALKTFVLAGWSPSLDEFKGQVLVSDGNKERIRAATLELATSADTERKVQNAASYVVSKIASADFPQDWSGLLPTVLHVIPTSSGSRLHGALKVLADLVEDGFSEDQFFSVAQDLVSTVHGVAQNVQVELMLRALAVSVFRSSFDTLEMVLEDHKSAVKQFAEQTISVWMPVLTEVLSFKLLQREGQPELYKGMIALKVQVVKVLMRVRIMFPSILQAQSMTLFSTTWEELSTLQPMYKASYIDDSEDGRGEDSDGLQYTLDFLILEELDFLQACLRAPPVAKELSVQLQTAATQDTPSWIVNLLRLATTYAQITNEDEATWEMDTNVFVEEETSVLANYTSRASCGDLAVKLGEKHSEATISAVLTILTTLQSAPETQKEQEAVLYLLCQVLLEWEDKAWSDDAAIQLLQCCQRVMREENIFLRARGHTAASILIKTSEALQSSNGISMMENTLRSTADESEVVQIACIKAMQNYLSALSKSSTKPLQSTVVNTIVQWHSTKTIKDLTESRDIVMTVLETLRDAILLDTTVCVNGEGLSLFFSIGSTAAVDFQVADLVGETFEEICESVRDLGEEVYSQLCEKIVSSLAAGLDVSSYKDENPVAILATDLLSSLSKHAFSPLPAGFIPRVLPKLTPHLLQSDDPPLLRSATDTVHHIIQHDSATLFAYTDPTTNKSGLETVLIIIDRLLGPDVEDAAAAKVGDLAGAVVEHAGHSQLGPYLVPLLQAVAFRLARATKATLTQSLILVFARLAIGNALEIVDFLSSLTIPAESLEPSTSADMPLPSLNSTPNSATSDVNGLTHLLPKWLDASATFVGYDAIRTNVSALARLYSLHDPRIACIPCRGDLIPNPATAGRIVTRSRAKRTPDSYTTVSASAKIVRVLVDELAGMGDAAALTAAGRGLAGGDEDDDDDDLGGDDDDGDDAEEWEDDNTFLDLGLGATKADLMSFGNGGGLFPGASMGMAGQQRSDDGTQLFLEEWFRAQATQTDAERREAFMTILGGLGEKDMQKLRMLG